MNYFHFSTFCALLLRHPNRIGCPIQQILNAFYTILTFKYRILYACKLTTLSWRKSTDVREGTFYSFPREMSKTSCSWVDFHQLKLASLNSIFKINFFARVMLFRRDTIDDVIFVKCSPIILQNSCFLLYRKSQTDWKFLFHSIEIEDFVKFFDFRFLMDLRALGCPDKDLSVFWKCLCAFDKNLAKYALIKWKIRNSSSQSRSLPRKNAPSHAWFDFHELKLVSLHAYIYLKWKNRVGL